MMNFNHATLGRFRLLAFLCLCCVFGGTSQWIMEPKIGLYLISAIVIAYIIWTQGVFDLLARTKLISFIFGSFILVSVLQLVPLAPVIWEGLPNRSWVSEGFSGAGEGVSGLWMPLSLSPELGLVSLVNLLPPIAAYFMVTHMAEKEELELGLWGLCFFIGLTVLLGMAQVLAPNDALHPYSVTNSGLPVGFFSNSNHQATLMLIGLAFAICSFTQTTASKLRFGLTGILTCLLIVGLLTNSSIAGYLLTFIVIGLAALLVFSKQNIGRSMLIAGFVLLPLVGFLVYDMSKGDGLTDLVLSKMSTLNEMSRGHVFQESWKIAMEFLPMGAGLGTFPIIFPFYEDMSIVSNIYLPHVHNDYIELVVEFGVFAIIWIALFAVWVLARLKLLTAGRARKSKRRNAGRNLALPAMIAIIAICLHSSVDYPMRTISVSTLFAVCVGLVERYALEQA